MFEWFATMLPPKNCKGAASNQFPVFEFEFIQIILYSYSELKKYRSKYNFSPLCFGQVVNKSIIFI